MYYLKSLYIFFIVLALNIFFFSTSNIEAKAFLVDEIEVSEKLENNFNKDKLINKGFKKAFNKLMISLIKSTDLKKTNNVTLKEIKSMIETFSIKEEKFVNKSYYLNLGVSFNKKNIFDYLERKNIFPTQIIKEKFLFIPIIIDQKDDNLLIFSNNPIYENWNKKKDKNFLIEYLLPTEDLEDFNFIKQQYSNLENYDFHEIIEKYFLDKSIITLIFRSNDKIKVLSKINIGDKKIIKNDSFEKFDFNDKDQIQSLINELKTIYEDFWKENNLINTSIKLPLIIQVKNADLNLSSKFEESLNNIDLISSYFISKFNKDFIFYEVIFNGTPKNFINIMKDQNYNFDTQKKTWILK
jgi:hypothetical protein